MNKEDLAAEIVKKTRITHKAATDIITAMTETITKTVSKGKKVTLVGFGSFAPKKRAARKGVNPRTGETIKIAAKKVPTFTAGKAFKELVNKK